jgi:hypothetical protein
VCDTDGDGRVTRAEVRPSHTGEWESDRQRDRQTGEGERQRVSGREEGREDGRVTRAEVRPRPIKRGDRG